MTFQIDADGDYTATVTNSPGGPHIILVRKEWIDESDSQHREPVTVAVYDRETNEPVVYNGKEVTVTLGSRSEGVANGWYAFVAIGEKDPGDVYVLETQVGKNPVSAPLGDDGKQTCPTFTGKDVTDPTAIEYSTDNHKYASPTAMRKRSAQNKARTPVTRAAPAIPSPTAAWATST